MKNQLNSTKTKFICDIEIFALPLVIGVESNIENRVVKDSQFERRTTVRVFNIAFIILCFQFHLDTTRERTYKYRTVWQIISLLLCVILFMSGGYFFFSTLGLEMSIKEMLLYKGLGVVFFILFLLILKHFLRITKD